MVVGSVCGYRVVKVVDMAGIMVKYTPIKGAGCERIRSELMFRNPRIPKTLVSLLVPRADLDKLGERLFWQLEQALGGDVSGWEDGEDVRGRDARFWDI